VRGSATPACAYASITRPEQSKHPPVPPKQYHFPAWRSAHLSAMSRFGFVAAEAGDGASGASIPAMRRADSAARMPLISARTGLERRPAGPAGRMVMVPDVAARAAAGPAVSVVN
jgi:hypothetical protein